jgi:RNA polymerase sigma-70 factor (ECF subfamily)
LLRITPQAECRPVTAEHEREAASLMRQAQAGDQTAYASLLALLTSICGRFARGRIGNVPWVDDVVQETLMTIHAARHTYDPARPFAPWFYAIASNRLIDVLRRERRVTTRELATDALPDVAAPADPSAADAIDVKAIHTAMASLPPRQRDVIQRLKFHDQSVRDVAGELKMSESAVKVTAHRGYRVLRRLLGEERED